MDKVDEASDLLLDLRLDSFSILDFVARLEKRFHLDIPDSEIKNFRTIGSILDIITGVQTPEVVGV